MAYAPPAASPALLKSITEEIKAGLKNEAERLDSARRSLWFYNLNFEMTPVRQAGQNRDNNRFPRYSPVMQRVVNVLTANLYKDGPKRTLSDSEAATEWLAGIYRANCVDSLFQQADRMATATDVAMFQVLPTTDPLKPIRILLWDASQFCAWCDPDDPAKAVAIAILDVFNERRRLRVWTAETVQTWATKELASKQTTGGTAFVFQSERPNDLGFLPFSFVHFNQPLTDFWSNGPGTFLADVNDGMNFALTQNFDCIRFNLRPIIVGKNIRSGWAPPSVMPGDIWFPPADPDAAGETDTIELDYLQADSSFVAASWDDFQAYLDHVLEMCGVPPATVRMTQDSARSGVSIIAEQAPLILWAKSRQRPFSYYEDELAKLVLAVGARHLGAQEDQETLATAAELEALSYDPKLVLRWPKMFPDMPGIEQDQADQFLLDNRIASRVTVVMRRESMTREEAEAYLEEIAEDLKFENELFGEAELAQAETDAAKMEMMTKASTPPDAENPGEEKPNVDE